MMILVVDEDLIMVVEAPARDYKSISMGRGETRVMEQASKQCELPYAQWLSEGRIRASGGASMIEGAAERILEEFPNRFLVSER